MKGINILILTKYGRLGASSRMRFMQYLPWLERANIHVSVQPLISDELLQKRYQRGGYGVWPLLCAYAKRWQTLSTRQHFDLLWIEKEALPWTPLWIESELLRDVPYVLDYDDAVFHQYDQHPNALVRSVFGQRLDGLMRGAVLVVGGNSYLAQRARNAGARRVEVLPTVVDLDRYRFDGAAPAEERIPRIVWVGSPSTTRYLELLQEPMRALAARLPFVFRVIGGDREKLAGIPVEVVRWAEDSEVESINSCDVGVMPLLDSAWERGKCGYKLIQYMACGLPVVASPIGVNKEIVRTGENGYLADSCNQWVDALSELLTNSCMRAEMGRQGRRRVEEEYCVQQVAPRLLGLLREALN